MTQSTNKKTISVCIPVFNEAQNLPVAVRAVEEVFKTRLPGYSLEIIVTDNASTDTTWEVALGLARSRSNLFAYRLSRNFGYQNSVFAGLFLATGDAVVELDADLEDPPEVIPEFVAAWEKGFDVAYGVRATRQASTGMKFLFSSFYKVLNRLSELKIPENSGDFRLLDRKILDVLKGLPERNLYLRGLVTFLGFKQTPVVYDRQARASGVSKFRFFHYTALAVDAITAFTKTPLRMIGVIGAGMFGLSLLLSGYYVYLYFVHKTPVAGFTTLVILTLILHSITFIFLGVLGEYLSRVFDDSKNRPRVIIAESSSEREYPRVI